ncbi:hypothetical protein SESBI_39944 [Sesbania bispinosa]|nr:hypothetical protein SESBI_39944 [Sesbania bispinosa]
MLLFTGHNLRKRLHPAQNHHHSRHHCTLSRVRAFTTHRPPHPRRAAAPFSFSRITTTSPSSPLEHCCPYHKNFKVAFICCSFDLAFICACRKEVAE